MIEIPKPETAQRTVWIGLGGVEYACEKDAVISFVKERLIDLFDGLPDYRDLSAAEFASLVLDYRADVIRWLQAVDAADA